MVQPVVNKEDCVDDSALASSLARVDLNRETRQVEECDCGEVSITCTPPTDGGDANAATAGDETLPTSSLDAALHPRRIICDLGYGFPKEERPRRERILAVAKQLVNLLLWQRDECQRRRHKTPDICTSDSPGGNVNSTQCSCARLVLVDCPDEEVRLHLRTRMNELWTTTRADERNHELQVPNDPCEFMTELPANFLQFSDEALSSMVESSSTLSQSVVYLSPDSDRVLDAAVPPPDLLVVGMLIDRRIQPLRSLRRAEHLGAAAARLPLHRVSDVLDPNEPLNVDCILEGIQRWYWNYDEELAADASCSSDPATSSATSPVKNLRRCFDDAFILALQSHYRRHPERPQHKLR
jgi:hypothetical protein